MCGTCGRKRLSECTCVPPARCAKRARGRSSAGQGREQVYQPSWPSTAARSRSPRPSIRGFNRLAWAFPYAIGLLGLGIATAVAVRWSRSQPKQPATASASPIDPALEQRLADELRDLD